MRDVRDGVRVVLQELHDKHGAVTASGLVEAAKPEDSPAHDAFEWDDEKAGAEYRLMQARRYIRVVKVEYSGKRETLVHVPRVGGGEGAYKPASVVVEEPDEFDRAMKEAQSRMAAAASSVAVLETAAQAREASVRQAVTKARKAAEKAGEALQQARA